MTAALGQAVTLVAKDLRIEARNRHTLGLVAVLGLLIVTVLANSILVILSRAAGSLVTLLFWREQFRPIFGEGPLDATATAAGGWVQLGATLFASVLTVPLVLLPLAVFAVELTRHDRTHDV
jgi:hypothetical protein